ncbi:MAG: histidine--tRNA ligase [Lachnospiraceae bacterium]|nr:histidine--tRNA ligase [Lachnospiraceae bacterium]
MNKKPVTGMRDILPVEMEIRAYLLDLIRKTYKSFGYTEIETPVVESIENLQGKQGGENEKLIFKIMKRGEKFDLANAKEENDLADSGLRYDLTLPLARYYSLHQQELPKPFKALQIGPVFRAERPQKGRFREFYQCDIDVFGDASNLCETELILAMMTVLKKIGFKDAVIRVNDRKLLRTLAGKTGLPEDLYEDVFIALDKMDKIGEEGVAGELVKLGMEEAAAKAFLGDFKEVEIPENLQEIFDLVNSAKDGDFEVAFDPTLVRGMGYYTGPIFEVAVPEFGSSVGGGGRYDEMVGRFAGQPTPACGFSIGFERIVSILLENGFRLPDAKEKTAFLLERGLSGEKRAAALKEAAALRGEGRQVLVANMIKNKKFQKEQLVQEGYGDIREFYENPLS